MTLTEFSDEFDILYNNIKSQSAPGLDAYEKSVFLTLAQEEIVEKAYKGINVLGSSFEETEFSRRVLDKLVRQSTINTTVTNSYKIVSNSVVYELPNDVQYIIFEEANGTPVNCENTVNLSVLPIRHDEYTMQKDNPFRKPNLSQREAGAWRLDIADATRRLVEIVPPSNITLTNYVLRYIKKPLPIILVALSTVASGLTIKGLNVATNSELDDSVHRHILNRAVEMAKIHYEAGDPNSILQNNRIQI